MEVQIRAAGGDQRGHCGAHRAGAEAGGQAPGPHRHAPLEGLQGVEEPSPRTPNRVSGNLLNTFACPDAYF